MVFCCIVVWIQPDISGCQQDFSCCLKMKSVENRRDNATMQQDVLLHFWVIFLSPTSTLGPLLVWALFWFGSTFCWDHIPVQTRSGPKPKVGPNQKWAPKKWVSKKWAQKKGASKKVGLKKQAKKVGPKKWTQKSGSKEKWAQIKVGQSIYTWYNVKSCYHVVVTPKIFIFYWIP